MTVPVCARHSCLYWLFSSPWQTLWGGNYHLHPLREATKTQRGKVTSPGSHSNWVAWTRNPNTGQSVCQSWALFFPRTDMSLQGGTLSATLWKSPLAVSFLLSLVDPLTQGIKVQNLREEENKLPYLKYPNQVSDPNLRNWSELHDGANKIFDSHFLKLLSSLNSKIMWNKCSLLFW